jgi:class 3 adenylate cyclase
MNCPGCQARTEPGARFCEECGLRLNLACPGCGEPVADGKKFCRSCGTAIANRAPLRTPAPRPFAKGFIHSRAAVEGERKHVTVLFADVRASMEMLAGRDPEDAGSILDPVLELMMEAVHRHEGTVNQVMGDGIMALFGAPLAHEDHAVRACYAALRIQETVRDYARDLHRERGIPLQFRIGLNSGEVVVRSLGGDLRMDYTAVGQTTHVAARMEQIAAPDSILISEATHGLAEGFVVVKPLGPVAI